MAAIKSSTELSTAGRPGASRQGSELQRGRSLPVVYTVVLALLVTVATVYGLVAHDAYRNVPELLQQTWRAQDAVNLAALPLLVWTARRARNGSLRAHLVAVGVLTWITYGYANLAIGTPFNRMFLIYVTVLAMAGFAMLDGLVRVDPSAVRATFARAPRRVVAWFMIVSGTGIAGLWLSDIVVGLTGGTPANLHLAGLPNPTWVLDLAWIIPVVIAAGVLLLRDRAAGSLLAGVMLVMLLVLSVAMLTTIPFALFTGLSDDPAVAPQLVKFTVVFTLLGTIEAWLLATSAHRAARPAPIAWIRRGWWPDEK